MNLGGLSEKAKGKQRAVEPAIEPAEEANPPLTRRLLTIRFTDGKPDLQVVVEVDDSVRDIKRKVRSFQGYFMPQRLT